MVDLRDGFPLGTFLSLIFILVASDMYVHGVSASQSFWIWSLGMLAAIPMMVVKVVTTASGGLLAPLAALAFLWWLVFLKDTLGEAIYWGIFSGALIMFLGV